MNLSQRLQHPDGLREEAVTLASGSGSLRGVFVEAAEPQTVAVLFLHGWGGGRCGPHDLLAHLAREIGRAGWSSLRFDFSDRGESDGVDGGVTLDQMGEDALAAAAFLQERAACKRLALVGICSGGNVGIGILDRLPACDSLFLLSFYPFSEGDSFGRRSNRTAKAAQGYLRKLGRLSTYRKLVRGAIDFRAIWQVLFGHHQRDAAQTSERERVGQSPLDNLRVRPLTVTMIYGDADPDTAASMQYFRDYAAEHKLPLAFEVIEGADHNYYSVSHSARLAAAATAFLSGVK